MTEPVLWAGLVMLAGALGAMAARAVRLPAASGALGSGLILAAAGRAGGWAAPWPDLGIYRLVLTVFLCFLLGTEMDLTRLARMARPLVSLSIAQAAAVLAFVCAACLWLGMGWNDSFLISAGAVAASPAALVAVSSEARARGDFTQRLYALTSLGLLIGIILFDLVAPMELVRLAESLVLGAVCGAVIMIPLSRMATRGAIVTCAGAGMLLLSAAARGGSRPGSAALMSVVAGFVAGNLLPNRDLIRDALREVTLPAAVSLFAIAGSMLPDEPIVGILVSSILVVAARGAGLFMAGALVRGPAEGLTQAAALLPMAGVTAMVVTSSRYGVAITLIVAGLLSEAVGMSGIRWGLVRSGEGAALSEDPDAWRAPMR